MEYLDLGHVVFRKGELIKASIKLNDYFNCNKSVMILDFKDNPASFKPEDKTLIVSDLIGQVFEVSARYCRKYSFLPTFEEAFKALLTHSKNYKNYTKVN